MPTGGATLSPVSSPFSNSFSVLSDESLDDSPLCFDFDSVNVSPSCSQRIFSVSLYSCSIPTLSVKLLDPAEQLPTRGSVSAAGYDLYSSEYSVIPPGPASLSIRELLLPFPLVSMLVWPPVRDLPSNVLMLVLVL